MEGTTNMQGSLFVIGLTLAVRPTWVTDRGLDADEMHALTRTSSRRSSVLQSRNTVRSTSRISSELRLQRACSTDKIDARARSPTSLAPSREGLCQKSA